MISLNSTGGIHLKNLLLFMATAILATACGGGGSSGSPSTGGGTAAVSAPALLSGPNTGAMQVYVTSLDDKQPIANIIIMIDDGGPTQTTDTSGYVSFTGLAAGAHNVFAFGKSTGATRFVAMMQVDRAHVELQMQRSAAKVSTMMSVNGNFAGLPVGSYVHTDLTLSNGLHGNGYYQGNVMGGMSFQYTTPVTSTSGTYISLTRINGMTSRASSLGTMTFRKLDVTTNGRTTVDSVALSGVNFLALVGTAHQNIIPFNMNFAATTPAPNLSITETAIPPVGVTAKAAMKVFPNIASAEGSLNVYSALFTDKAIATPYYKTAGETPIAIVKGGTNEGAATIALPGDRWSMSNEIPATGIVTHNTGFTGKCLVANNQTGTTIAFTPATGLISYHELLLKTSPTAMWYVYTPSTATSVTLPTTVPVGATNPYPAAGVAYTNVASVACVYRNGQTYASFAEGKAAPVAGYVRETYQTDVRYSPF